MSDTETTDPPIHFSSADGHGEVHASISMEFGNESPVVRYRGVSLGAYPRAAVTLSRDSLSLEGECEEVCEQIMDMLDEARTNIIKMIWSRYETYRTAEVGADDGRSMQRLEGLLFRLGISH